MVFMHPITRGLSFPIWMWNLQPVSLNLACLDAMPIPIWGICMEIQHHQKKQSYYFICFYRLNSSTQFKLKNAIFHCTNGGHLHWPASYGNIPLHKVMVFFEAVVGSSFFVFFGIPRSTGPWKNPKVWQEFLLSASNVPSWNSTRCRSWGPCLKSIFFCSPKCCFWQKAEKCKKLHQFVNTATRI